MTPPAPTNNGISDVTQPRKFALAPQIKGDVMLGSLQRKLVWQAYLENGEWSLLNPPGSSQRELITRWAACKRLVEWGLIESGHITDYTISPVKPRRAIRITRLGRQFAETYATQLRNGGRLRGTDFENIVGRRMAWQYPPGFGAHLRHQKAA